MITPIPSFLADYLPQERKQLYKKEKKAKDNSFAFLLTEEEHKLEKERKGMR